MGRATMAIQEEKVIGDRIPADRVRPPIARGKARGADEKFAAKPTQPKSDF